MGGIAELLKVVLISCSRRILTRCQIFNDHQTLWAAYACHLADHPLWIFKMMECEARDDDVKLVLLKGQMLSISNLEAQIGESALLTLLLGNLERCCGQIKANYLATCFCKGHSDVAGAGCHIKNTRPGLRVSGLYETIEVGLVLDQRIRGIRLCLLCELLANDIFMIW